MSAKSKSEEKREEAEKKTAEYRYKNKAAQVGIEAAQNLPTFFGALSYYGMKKSTTFTLKWHIPILTEIKMHTNTDLQNMVGMTQALLPGVHFTSTEREAFSLFKARTKLKDVK